MKKKRVLLHICILLLAAVCLSAGLYVCYWVLRDVNYDYTHEYNETYRYDVANIFAYQNVQSEMLEKFGDESKVLIENEEQGNVTAGDIGRIFADKYNRYYTDDITWGSYDDFEENIECVYEEEDILVMQYYADRKQKRHYRKEWENNPTEENLQKYRYYESKCAYVDEYAEMAEVLLKGCEYDGMSDMNIVSIIDDGAQALANKTYPDDKDGIKYYLRYNLGEQQYVISNIASKETAEKEQWSDRTTLDNGVLIQTDALYGDKKLNEIEDIYDVVIHPDQVKELYIGVDFSDTDSDYYTLKERIEKQLPEEKQQIVKKNLYICIGVIVATLVIACICYILLMVMAGHREKGDTAALVKVDKFWWDVEFLIFGCVCLCALACFTDWYDWGYYRRTGIVASILALPAVEVFVLLSESLMRRIKTGKFMQTTLSGKLWKLIKFLAGKLRNGIRNLLGNMGLTWKVVILAAAVFIWQIIMVFIAYEYMEPGWAAVFGLVVIVGLCYLVWRYFEEVRIIEDGARKIAEGDISYKIEDRMKFKVNDSLRDCVNNIGDGLNGAVEESVKNERMKTELITNVSHDLKTPLTSIINYVDLLKTEGVDSGNAEKYLEVLDVKSQRLKNLTEDLVEASKLNSGAIHLNREKLDIVQLVNQSLAEYDEKFQQKNLRLIKTVQEEPLYVLADGRKTWRLFDNLYNNIFKYAMAGTRVYIDIRVENKKAVVSLKNISENPLNFNADELTERFVRGDASRTTDGSGLGLSIAKSIAERQDGRMEITLDGDLFKVEVMMNLI